MRIRDYNNTCVVDIDDKTISQNEICELEKLLSKKALKKRVGLNLENVTALTHEFGKLVQNIAQNTKVSLFNLSNDLLLFLYVAKYDKSVDIYMSESDFSEDKYSFVNRRFKVLKSQS